MTIVAAAIVFLLFFGLGRDSGEHTYNKKLRKWKILQIRKNLSAVKGYDRD